MPIRSRTLISVTVAAFAITACESATGPEADTISVCLPNGSAGTLSRIRTSQLADYKRHGAYVANLVVSKKPVANDDSIHFTRIGDALAVARAGRLARAEMQTAACRITIAVDTGVFQGTTDGTAGGNVDKWPLVIDVPDISLIGSFKMQVDARGRATGAGEGGRSTVLSPAVPLPFDDFSQPLIIVNGHPNGSAGHGATIEGFVLQSGHAGGDDEPSGQGVFTLRVHALTIAGNRIEGPFSESLDLRASSGLVDRNFLNGMGRSCDICLAGPGDYQATSNRLIAGGIPGFLIVATTLIPVDTLVEQYDLPSSATVYATVMNNEVRNHLRQPVGAGLRVGAIGLGAPDVAGSAHAVAHDNDFDNNTFGVLVEGAFPVSGTLLRGDIDLTLGGNRISHSCQHDLLVALSRHTTVLGLTNLPYLHDSHYTLALGGDVQWADAWYGHPAGYGNTLVVDGVTIPNGARSAYDANKICSPTNPLPDRTRESRASLSR
ncbi:MAG: hypothetical protein ABI889_14500 [Gemmatimonadota bacterium]